MALFDDSLQGSYPFETILIEDLCLTIGSETTHSKEDLLPTLEDCTRGLPVLLLSIFLPHQLLHPKLFVAFLLLENSGFVYYCLLMNLLGPLSLTTTRLKYALLSTAGLS